MNVHYHCKPLHPVGLTQFRKIWIFSSILQYAQSTTAQALKLCIWSSLRPVICVYLKCAHIHTQLRCTQIITYTNILAQWCLYCTQCIKHRNTYPTVGTHGYVHAQQHTVVHIYYQVYITDTQRSHYTFSQLTELHIYIGKESWHTKVPHAQMILDSTSWLGMVITHYKYPTNLTSEQGTSSVILIQMGLIV